MDDNKKAEPNRPATPMPERRSFMDIQPPQPAVKPPEPVDSPTPEAQNFSPVPAAPEPVTAEPPVTVPEAHQEKTEAVSNGLSPELLAQAQKETAKPAHDPNAKPKKAPKNRRPAIIIVLALLVFAGLSSVAVYAYTQSQKKLPAEQTQMIEEDHTEHENHEDASTEMPANTTEDPANTPVEKAEELDKTVNDQNSTDETQAPDAETREPDTTDVIEPTP